MENQVFRYTFFGRVFPERANVNITSLEFTLKQEEANLSGDLNISIGASQITAIYSTLIEVGDLYTVRNYVEDVIRLEVDILGYLNGCGYDVEITGVINSQTNETVIFGVEIGALWRDREKRPKRFDEILGLFSGYKSDYLRRCLSDLREATRSSRDTGLFCYRAIEALRQFFKDEKGALNDADSWEKLREWLKVERVKIDFIKSFADPVRHGGTKFISGQDRIEILKTAWDVTDSFIIYASKGYIS